MEQLVSTVITSCPLSSLAIVVVIDLSRPEHIFEELLHVIDHLKVQHYLKKMSLLI